MTQPPLPVYNHHMPELPEVQRVRQSLTRHLLGRTVVDVQINRADIITGQSSPAALLVGQTLVDIQRHGKQLALVTSHPPQDTASPNQNISLNTVHASDQTSDPTSAFASSNAPCLCVHLGMTGSLQYHPPGVKSVPQIQQDEFQDDTSPSADPLTQKHVHIVWKLDNHAHITFRDPRRFGGLWSFPNFHTLHTQRWSNLGHDALTITPKQLHAKLAKTQRPIKAALLDQVIVAGLGNIYVDEALFAVRLHPMTSGASISQEAVSGLVRAFKTILKRAIASGGSTIRNYADGDGNAGSFQKTLKVYGRAGQSCVVCKQVLISTTVIGRTTTLCQYCQGVPLL